jgi:L1 cell adhesion molecule like protein
MVVAIGIDLGTTYTCAAYYNNSNVDIIPGFDGQRLMASIVNYSDEVIVGNPAKNMDSAFTITGSKRIIGRLYDNVGDYYDKDRLVRVGDAPIYRLVRDDVIVFNGSAEDVAADILAHVRKYVTAYIGEDIRDAVITVPANFDNNQRTATLNAAKAAGLNILRIINEPTAAALAANIRQGRVLICDIGGGTSDYTLLDVIADSDVYEIIGSYSDHKFGGIDIDLELAGYIRGKIGNITLSQRHISRINAECERVKRVLSNLPSATFAIEALIDDRDISYNITRSQFNTICDSIFFKIKKTIKNFLTDLQIDINSVDNIILVGGTTRIPRISEILRELFPNKPIDTSNNPDESVAIGAAIMAANIAAKDTVNNTVLLDVSQLSLGIEQADGTMAVIIPKNTTIPCDMIKTFTIIDPDIEIRVRIYEGERMLCNNNILVGELIIKEYDKSRDTIDICLSIDVSGVLEVTAIDNNNRISATFQRRVYDNNTVVALGELSREDREIELKKRGVLEKRRIIDALIASTKRREDADKYRGFIEYCREWMNDDTELELDIDVYCDFINNMREHLKINEVAINIPPPPVKNNITLFTKLSDLLVNNG